MKRRVLIMSVLLSMVLTACGSQETVSETSATIENETEISEDSVEVDDENGLFTGEYKRILPICKPDGFIYYGMSNYGKLRESMEENDTGGLYYTRKNKIFI